MNTPGSAKFRLEQHGLTVAEVYRNLPPSAIYEHAIRFDKEASIAENGALVAYSGVKTGRSPKDKRVVKHPHLKNTSGGDPSAFRVTSAHSKSTGSARLIISTRASTYAVGATAEVQAAAPSA